MKCVNFQRTILLLLLTSIIALLGCNKDKFLDKKPNTQLVVPTTLTDFQALLDNQYIMQETPELGELSADNFYMTYNVWQGLVIKEQNAYLWAKDIYANQGQVPDWDIPYQQVFYANVILEGLSNIKVNGSNRQQWNTIKGSALFIRAYAFYNLSQLFAPVYNVATASKDMGIALRLSSDVNERSIRASVQETYDRILGDLRQADSLLLDSVPTANLNRPSRPAALALLARVCLSMQDYDQASIYANRCLQLYHTLIDYNTLNYSQSIPIRAPNYEALYQTVMLRSSGVLVGALRANIMIDSILYNSYAPGDLRKVIFYKLSNGVPYLKGSYNGSGFCFSGLAVDEVYLIRAECAARVGNKDAALIDLNTLLQHRWVKPDSMAFTPVTAASAAAALDSVLVERRKELAFRGLRWTDLRRLNKEGANIIISHGLNSRVYRLPPSSPNYVFYLPPDVIALSKMPDYENRVVINPN